MAQSFLSLLALATLASSATISYGTFTQAQENDTTLSEAGFELKARAGGDPGDFSWVKRCRLTQFS